ncbi:MAG: hypothetical protein R8N23_09745 [Reichenbachiella sp.]|uniref:hypothetical protein n=1 Tax=Reichenbachiella sp. TaxID=2184521 RepID=UPI002967713C|nr:hypothetical protein [Reichenbachiella sp.]MDW3210141.1 hypothetical protein [Reichenbachiella sp.]
MKLYAIIGCFLISYFGHQGVVASPKDTVNNLTKNEKVIIGNLKLSMSAQLWLRHTELNPGSQIDGLTESSITDLSIRRFRMALHGNLTDRLYVKTQIGLNNMNYVTSNAQLKLLDLLAVYRLSDRFYIGGGKNGYTGPSRYASVASSAMLGVDIPIFALSTINITDDLLRKLSVFAKGDIGQLGYRLVLAKPDRPHLPLPLDSTPKFANGDPKLQYSGYFKYQFLEKEGMTSAYMPGTYHGTKKVLNVGFGFLVQDKATWNMINNDTTYYRMNQWAIDVFADLPLNTRNSQSVTLYAAYFNTDFGPEYIRMIGTNNSGIQTNNTTINGAGNKYPAIGTGQVYYLQLGYRVAFSGRLEKLGAIQPYFNMQHANYDALTDPMRLFESGVNLLFNGHRSKLTFGYQNRPIYSLGEGNAVSERKNMYVIQYQFKL